MMIKFLAHGTGKASSAATYLLDSHDHKGEERAGVAVLRGDPQQFAAVADSLDFQHRYRSAVISWSEEEAPSDAEIGAVLDDFEAMGQPFLDLFSDVQRKAPKGAKAERARAQRKGPAGKEPRLLAARSATPPSNRGVRSDPKPRKKPVTARASARFTDFDSLSPNPLQNRGQK